MPLLPHIVFANHSGLAEKLHMVLGHYVSSMDWDLLQRAVSCSGLEAFSVTMEPALQEGLTCSGTEWSRFGKGLVEVVGGTEACSARQAGLHSVRPEMTVLAEIGKAIMWVLAHSSAKYYRLLQVLPLG